MNYNDFDMNNLIGKWGGVNLRNVNIERERDCVYFEDIKILEDYPYLLNLHQCVNTYENYIVVEFYKIKIRIMPVVFHPLDVSPKFKPFVNVKLYNTKGELEFGVIKGIHWHNNEHEFYYDIEVNGKMKSRRYYNEELDLIENRNDQFQR